MMQILLTRDAAPEFFDITTFDFANQEPNTVFALPVHNPLAWSQQKYVSIFVTDPAVTITDHSGIIISSQVIHNLCI
jgi:hypothetical protein